MFKIRWKANKNKKWNYCCSFWQ